MLCLIPKNLNRTGLIQHHLNRIFMPRTMLCACSGEQFKFEDIPQSPESLATRDFSASGFSSRTGDWDSKIDDNDNVDDVESILKEAVSLNYEEARALLGRLEYQRGNFEAALQVFQGINTHSLGTQMSKAIEEQTQKKKERSKGENSVVPAMSMHSVNLLLEAILLKAKSLTELDRPREAARECRTVIDVVEAALPKGLHLGLFDDCKMQEMFHKALNLLPRLWKQAGCLEDAISSYRRALVKPWNLDSEGLASIQKDLAILLLYGGIEASLPPAPQPWGAAAPENNIEEALFLLLILMRKLAFKEIPWDGEIMNHLTFALSMTNQFDILADHFMQILPGVYNREERWYLLALCYSSTGKNDDAINLLKMGFSHFDGQKRLHLPSLLLGSKLCSQSLRHAHEGIDFAQKAMGSLNFTVTNHFMGSLHHFIGISYGHCSRLSASDSERLFFEDECLKSLNNASMIDKHNPEIFFSLGLENLIRRNFNLALQNAKRYMEMVSGTSLKGWKLLAIIISAAQSFPDAEAIVDLAFDETGKKDQLDLLRLKGLLQSAQEHFKLAIETYKVLLSAIHGQRDAQTTNLEYEGLTSANLEMEAWQDLASIYTNIGSLNDAKICLEKAKSIKLCSARTWQAAGRLLEAKSLYRESLGAYFISLSIEPDYVPSMVSAAALLRRCRKSLPTARSLLMNSLRLDPRNHDAWLNLGYVSKMEGSLQEAAHCFQAACELKETSPIEGFFYLFETLILLRMS